MLRRCGATPFRSHILSYTSPRLVGQGRKRMGDATHQSSHGRGCIHTQVQTQTLIHSLFDAATSKGATAGFSPLKLINTKPEWGQKQQRFSGVRENHPKSWAASIPTQKKGVGWWREKVACHASRVVKERKEHKMRFPVHSDVAQRCVHVRKLPTLPCWNAA